MLAQSQQNLKFYLVSAGAAEWHQSNGLVKPVGKLRWMLSDNRNSWSKQRSSLKRKARKSKGPFTTLPFFALSEKRWLATRPSCRPSQPGTSSSCTWATSCWVREERAIATPLLRHTLSSFSVVFAVVNSSINILIYSCLSAKFRTEAVRVLTCGRRGWGWTRRTWWGRFISLRREMQKGRYLKEEETVASSLLYPPHTPNASFHCAQASFSPSPAHLPLNNWKARFKRGKRSVFHNVKNEKERSKFARRVTKMSVWNVWQHTSIYLWLFLLNSVSSWVITREAKLLSYNNLYSYNNF